MVTPSEEITPKPPQPDVSDSDPRGPIEERYFSILRWLRLFRTCPVLAPVADGHIPGGHRSGLKRAPAKARPVCLPWSHSCDLAERVCPSEVGSRMRNHVSAGLADEYTAINILEEGLHRSHGLPGNISGEGTSTVHNFVSRGASPSGKFDSIAREYARSILLQGGRSSADGTAKSPESAFGCQTWGPQFPQARGGRGTNHLTLKPITGGDGSGSRSCMVKARSHGSLEYDVPTMWNVSGEGTSTMHNPISCGASPSSDFDVLAHEHSDIDLESGHVQFFDRTQQIHSGPRWTILGDPLMDVIVQGPFALVGLKMSNASSPAKDVLVRVVVIVYAVGFLSAMGGKLRGNSIKGGKLRGSSTMEGIGSAAAVLGFLLTMILLLL